ncbi:EamA family transporter [Chloroflexota bacterium]
MSWIVIALASAAVSGGVSIVDKVFLQNYARSHVTLWLLIAILQGTVGIVFVAAFAWSGSIASTDTLWALLSGVIFGFGGLFLLYVLNSQEVSRAVPVTQTAPIFAAIIAYFFLAEALTASQWLAVVVTVVGAVLLSMRRDVEYRRLFLHPSFFLLMAASVIFAVGQVIGKVSLDTLSVPLVHGLRSLGLSAVFLAASLSNRDAQHDLMRLIRSRSPGLALVTFSELVLVTVAFLLFLWALSKGSVGLVSALAATRSLFILVYSTLLSLRFRGLLGERVIPSVLAIKLASIILIVAGVTAITMA